MTQAPDLSSLLTLDTLPPTDVLRRLAALERASTADLKQHWRELFGKEPPAFSRTYLQSRLAYRIQELAYGGLRPETVARLEALGEKLDGGSITLRRIRADDRPSAGTRLVREYQGVQHVVAVLPDGFEYEGRPYRSLSAIARAITGTRWNGWTFFWPTRTKRSMSRRNRSEAVPPPAAPHKRRCAVYTRVSSDEGLQQAFSSLDAQRDACEAYVASQRAEGWVLLDDRYDDGGLSGATLERPALRRLLADIEVGRIDVVVVYKIDRLSRSLMDFTKVVEIFDQHDVTFVSVTQAFSTTTSMGRLTLNILLSFAQFEREVIGERIRDKFAASRARGMWMGGSVPLGYRVFDRKLVVNEPEAATVRGIFTGFAEIGSGTKLTKVLRSEGVTTKRGKPINKADIYKLLNNRTYVGEVLHKGNVYPGEHRGIVSRELWDRVHRVLQESPRARANKNRAQSPALLRGLIFGADGRAMSPTHTRRHGKLYRYYVSQSVLKGDSADNVIRRVSAAKIETAVIAQVRALLRQPEIVVGTWMAARGGLPELTEDETREALERLDPLWDELFPAERTRIIRLLVERVDIGLAGADIRLRIAGLTSLVRDLGATRDDAVVATA